jgi:hypothetical protein
MKIAYAWLASLTILALVGWLYLGAQCSSQEQNYRQMTAQLRSRLSNDNTVLARLTNASQGANADLITCADLQSLSITGTWYSPYGDRASQDIFSSISSLPAHCINR